jgi:hypothetical protein
MSHSAITGVTIYAVLLHRRVIQLTQGSQPSTSFISYTGDSATLQTLLQLLFLRLCLKRLAALVQVMTTSYCVRKQQTYYNDNNYAS